MMFVLIYFWIVDNIDMENAHSCLDMVIWGCTEDSVVILTTKNSIAIFNYGIFVVNRTTTSLPGSVANSVGVLNNYGKEPFSYGIFRRYPHYFLKCN